MKHAVRFLATPAPLYYELLEPDEPTDLPPAILITGGGHTGACFQTTPDGRPGWAYRFVEAGYRVVVPDWPGTGRSGHLPLEEINSETTRAAVGGLIESFDEPVIVLTHSLSGSVGWKLLELHGDAIVGLVGVAPAPPGNIHPEPTLISSSETMVELESEGGIHWAISLDRPLELSEQQIRDKLIGASTRFPTEALAAYRASLIPVPPRCIAEGLNVGGAKPSVRDTTRLLAKRVLVVTGGVDTDHPRDLDEAIVEWLRDAGALAEFISLPDRGIDGNGHMLMLERNSDEIVELIIDWLRRG